MTAISAGDSHGLAVRGGAVFAWGRNDDGQLGNNSTANSSVPVAVTGSGLGTGVTAVSGGGGHSLAVKGGAVYAWGANFTGQLGNASTTSSLVPVAVTGSGLNAGVTAVSGGVDHSLAIKGGALYAWGRNANGQLGINSTANSSVPVAVTGSGLNSGVTAISAGTFHSLAVKNGAVFAWGSNANGQLGNNSTTDSLVPIRAGGPLASITNVTTVSARGYASLALTADHRLFAWGANFAGQFGNGTTADSLVPIEVFAPSGLQFDLIDSGGIHALAILTPVPVPEPAGVLAVAGLAALGLRRRRLLRR